MLLTGNEDSSLVGHLNNCVLGGREEWSAAIPIIGKKAMVTHTSQIRVIFVVLLLLLLLFLSFRQYSCFCMLRHDNRRFSFLL